MTDVRPHIKKFSVLIVGFCHLVPGGDTSQKGATGKKKKKDGSKKKKNAKDSSAAPAALTAPSLGK